MSSFTWVPDYQASVDHSPTISQSSFGDGYSQRASNGINADLKKWNLVFSNKDLSEGNDIDDFLKTHKAVTEFDWLDPDGDNKKYICKSWRKSYPQFGVVTINCTFEEVP